MPTPIRTVVIAFVLVLGLATADVRAQGGPFIQSPGDLFLNVYAGAARANTYYNVDGNSRLFDTLGTTLSVVSFGVSGSYGLLESLELNVELPLAYLQLTSEDKFPDRSIFAPVYLGLGGTYQFTRGTVYTSLTSMIKIPPGFHDGIYDDPEHPSFLSDGYLQWTTLAHAGMTIGSVWLKGSLGYNWRGEEPADEILYGMEIGTSSEELEGSGVFVGIYGVVSTQDASQPLRPFYAGASGSFEEQLRVNGGNGRFSTIDRENYVAVSAGAFASITDYLMLNGRYVLRLSGTNAIALQGGYLGVGVGL